MPVKFYIRKAMVKSTKLIGDCISHLKDFVSSKLDQFFIYWLVNFAH